MLPRATLFGPAGEKEWKSAILPRYHRRMPEVNEAIIAEIEAHMRERVVPRVEEHKIADLQIIEADVCDRKKIIPHFDGATWVFHLAALADIVSDFSSMALRTLALQTSSSGTGWVAPWLARSMPRRKASMRNGVETAASFFPSSGAVNPGLTVMANALRVGDHLMERLNRGRPGSA